MWKRNHEDDRKAVGYSGVSELEIAEFLAPENAAQPA